MANVNTPEYWNRVWKASGEGRRTVNAYVFAGSVAPSKGTILDLGCGVCAGTRLLREYGFNVTGMDFASEAGKAHKDAFLLYDVQEPFPVKAGSFDTVLAIMVIQCLNKPDAMIKEAHRALRPGGMFFVASPGMHRWREDYHFIPTLKELQQVVAERFVEGSCITFNYLAWKMVLATK